MNKVILLAGPGGSGKSTLADILNKNHGYVWLDGDQEDTEFFPNGGQWDTANSTQLRKAHQKILQRAIEIVNQGEKVVVDYIIFNQYLDYIRSFKKEFKDKLQIVVLLPTLKETIKRDQERQCWTTGEERIRKVTQDLTSIRGDVGYKNYLDTTGLTVDETISSVLRFN